MTKILLVEDDFAIASAVKALLKARGFEVHFEADGPEGLERARKVRADVLLLDLRLPRMGGLELCRALKTDPKTRGVKIIVLTALDRMGDVEKAFAAGADDYISKPYDNERLIKKIEKVLGDGDKR